jgi:hypothetical protein
MILQKGLWDLLEWQHFIPSIDPMPQDFIRGISFVAAALQMPQGVRATKTPSTKIIRLSKETAFRMD